MSESPLPPTPSNPLSDLDEWEDFLLGIAIPSRNSSPRFRDYGKNVRPGVREFYRLNHTHQTLDFVRAKEAEYLPRTRRRMGIWEAMEYLNTLVDDSDPDTELTPDRAPDADGRGDSSRRPSPLVHPHRPDPRPGQDSLPVRRASVGRRRRHVPGRLPLLRNESSFTSSSATTLTGTFRSTRPNPESTNRAAAWTGSTCRGATTSISIHVVKDHLPDEALAMIRYHSFYPAHREGAVHSTS